MNAPPSSAKIAAPSPPPAPKIAMSQAVHVFPDGILEAALSVGCGKERINRSVENHLVSGGDSAGSLRQELKSCVMRCDNFGKTRGAPKELL